MKLLCKFAFDCGTFVLLEGLAIRFFISEISPKRFESEVALSTVGGIVFTPQPKSDVYLAKSYIALLPSYSENLTKHLRLHACNLSQQPS